MFTSIRMHRIKLNRFTEKKQSLFQLKLFLPDRKFFGDGSIDGKFALDSRLDVIIFVAELVHSYRQPSCTSTFPTTGFMFFCLVRCEARLVSPDFFAHPISFGIPRLTVVASNGSSNPFPQITHESTSISIFYTFTVWTFKLISKNKKY